MATFRETALQNGYRAVIVPISRQDDIRVEIESFAATQELNGYQQFIVGQYEFAPPELPFEAKSIIMTAAPHPVCSEVVFALGGKIYKLYTANTPTDNATGDYVTKTVSEAEYTIEPTGFWFPFKRFAVQSGLCEYGRNNIAYAPGLGSYVAISAYYTDMPSDEDTWRGVVTSAQCEGCTVCESFCPTGAIIKDRFLIDNTLCLCGLNEGPGEEFPPFVPKNAHHAVVGCMRCQYSCPMNAPFKANIVPPVYFSEAETTRLLKGAPYDDLEGELEQNFKSLELYFAGDLPRNLRACFDLIDSGGACSLV